MLTKLKKMNPFLIISVVLNLGAALWYFKNKQYTLGLLFIGYAFCSAVTLFLKTN